VTDYECGFTIGEERAFMDRHDGERLTPPPPDQIIGQIQRGYWDGYMPRNPAWAVIHRTETV
jgi:hypothetical protein